jgi:hypothetical protein
VLASPSLSFSRIDGIQLKMKMITDMIMDLSKRYVPAPVFEDSTDYTRDSLVTTVLTSNESMNADT